MENRAIEIHDSVLESLAIEDGVAVISFGTAYIHSSRGRPGRDAGRGWTQKAKLRISEAEVDGSFPDFPCDLDGGYIRTDDSVSNNLVPVPLNYRGHVELRLESGARVLRVRGSRASLELLGEPTYVEEFNPG